MEGISSSAPPSNEPSFGQSPQLTMVQPFLPVRGLGPALAPIIVGIVLILVGAIILHSVIVMEAPRTGPTEPFYRMIRWMFLSAGILIDVGVFLFIIGSLVIGFVRVNVPDGVRRAALLAAAVVVAAWLFFVIYLTSLGYPRTYYP